MPTTTAWLDLRVTGAADITTGAVDIAPAPRSRSHRQDVALAVSGACGFRRHGPCVASLRENTSLSNLAIVVAARPGAPVGSLVMDLAPALAPVGMALLVIAVLGAIILLVGRDAHHRLPRVAAVRRQRVESRASSLPTRSRLHRCMDQL